MYVYMHVDLCKYSHSHAHGGGVKLRVLYDQIFPFEQKILSAYYFTYLIQTHRSRHKYRE